MRDIIRRHGKYVLLFLLLLSVLAIEWVWFGKVRYSRWLIISILTILLIYFYHQYHQLHNHIKQYLARHVFLGHEVNTKEVPYLLNKIQQEQHNIIAFEQQKYNSLIDALQICPYGVLILDEQQCVMWVNLACEKHLGLQLSRDVNQRLTLIIRIPELTRYIKKANFDQVLKLIIDTSIEMTQVQHKIILIHGATIQNKQMILFTEDITQTERINQVRRDFVANVSHEMKTPMTVVDGFIETLQDLPLSFEEQQEYLKIMKRQITRMKNLVNDLLTLARLESEQTVIKEVWIDMTRFIETMFQELRLMANHDHELRLINTGPTYLLASYDELVIAVSNLTSNACRYTPAKQSIELIWEATRHGGAALRVRDTGTGISSEHIPRLTERFYRVDDGRSRDKGGTGLGLAIVKHIAQRHHARLEIESSQAHHQHGSQFSLIFDNNKVATHKNQL